MIPGLPSGGAGRKYLFSLLVTAHSLCFFSKVGPLCLLPVTDLDH